MDIHAIIFNFPKAPDADERIVMCTLRRRGYRLAANFASGACDVFFGSSGMSKREEYLEIACKLGVPYDECAVVEGACDDLNEAKNAGMTAIGVGDAVNCIYADTGISNIADLLNIFV